jgi:hypothetical protein
MTGFFSNKERNYGTKPVSGPDYWVPVEDQIPYSIGRTSDDKFTLTVNNTRLTMGKEAFERVIKDLQGFL